MNSFAGARAHDHEVIREGVTYGNARDIIRDVNAMRGAIEELRYLLRVYFYAHQGGTAVPPYIEERARRCLHLQETSDQARS
jgi:hypothetical protein